MSYRRTTSPFNDADVLEEDYQPDEILGRDEELKQLRTVFQPIIDAEPPRNAFLYGLSGLGKTASTKYEISELTASVANYDDISLETIWLNCNDCSSSYQVAITLANQLLPAPDRLPRSGLPKSQVYETLFEALDAVGNGYSEVRDYVIIVLDEVDNIGSQDRILYQIPRARANGRLENVWPALIGISNDLSFKEGLSSKVTSSLCEHEITFSSYNATELQEILLHRSQRAFKEGTVKDGVIELTAAYGAQEGGDARYALDLLRRGGQLAKGEEEVRLEHIERAREELERDRMLEAIGSMDKHEHMTIAALVTLHLQNETPVGRKELYPVYRQYAEEIIGEVNASRRVHDYLSNMHMLGLIKRAEVQEGIGEETRFEYSLDSLSTEMAVKALERLDIPGHPETNRTIPSKLQQLLGD